MFDMRPGDKAVLIGVPETLLRGLPEEDQAAIKARVGKRVTFVGFSSYGEAEVVFRHGRRRIIHTIWVDPAFLAPV